MASIQRDKRGKGLWGLLLLAGAFVSLGAKGGSKSTNFVAPIKGKVGSGFGNRPDPINPGKTEYHNGVDIHADEGTPIHSPDSGTLGTPFSNTRGGTQVIITHDNGWKTGYAHLSKVSAKAGDKLSKGEIFAYTGSTGQVTGPHLHFTLTNPEGQKVDPEEYFSF